MVEGGGQMGLLEIILLGIVQGITEFLPISSSGHLVVGARLLEIAGSTMPQDLLEVNIVLHVGTLLSVLVVYWKWRMLGEERRVALLLVVGTLPAVAVTLLLKALDLEVPQSPLVAGCLFPVTAVLLLYAARGEAGAGDYIHLSWWRCLLIGRFPAGAILPAISRIVATIAAGLLGGLSRQSAATFAFLLALPAIGGAGILEAATLVEGYQQTKQWGVTTPLPHLLIGLLVSFAVGLLALYGLLRIIQHGRLYVFAYYLIPLGLVVVFWQLRF